MSENEISEKNKEGGMDDWYRGMDPAEMTGKHRKGGLTR